VELNAVDLRAAFGDDPGEVKVEPIDPELRLHSVTGGVYRVTAESGATLVLKIVRHGQDADPQALWVAGADPSHRNYWLREWLAFESGLLGDLPGQLRAPTTFLTTAPSPGEAWIWMEDVEGRVGDEWPVSDYASVAFDAGTTQGAYATGAADLPTYDWLSRGWLRGWVDALARHIPLLHDDAAWSGSLSMMAPLRERAADLWAHREELLAMVERAPQCLVHCDFWPMNLIAADDGTTVAVDWSQVGIGGVGQDLDQLTLDPVWMQVLPDGDLETLENTVLSAYLAGLGAAGMTVDEDELATWYAAAASVHYVPMMTSYAHSLSIPGRRGELEARHGRPIEAISADKARVVEHALALGQRVLL
jgi:Phosphotransferase enzyme family